MAPDEVTPVLESDLAQVYRAALDDARGAAQQVRAVSPAAADYLLPLA